MTITHLSHLALEVRSLDRAREFYEDRLGMTVVQSRHTDREIAYLIGDAGTTLILRRPRSTPRGGVHTHFAFSTPDGAIDEWRARCSDLDRVERTFGSYRSLYMDDPDGHCVEIGTTGGAASGCDTGFDRAAPVLLGIFEIVLEVTDLDRSEAIYRSLGFEVVDRDADRPRVRLRGPFDLELWEPHLGIADARGGLHVDLGIESDEPAVDAARFAAAVVAAQSSEAIEDSADSGVSADCDAIDDHEAHAMIDDHETGTAADTDDVIESIDGGFRVRDPDGHRIAIVEETPSSGDK